MDKQAILDKLESLLHPDYNVPMEFVMDEMEKFLTAQEGGKLAYPTGTDVTLVPMSLQKQIAKRMIEEFIKGGHSFAYDNFTGAKECIGEFIDWLKEDGDG